MRRQGCFGSGSFIVAAALALATVAPSSHGAPILTQGADGYTWSTITHAGNRSSLPSEAMWNPVFSRGGVAYEYRMATTEVSASQWIDFMRAYAPYVGSEYQFGTFMAGPIRFAGFSTQGVPQYTIAPGYENVAVGVGWRYAARYCNWLHNDRALTREAFDNGAYDATTFTSNPDGTFNDQLTHNADARYWIPTLDEWVKGVHYDPDRYGPGQEGYWMFPYAQAEQLISGYPGEPGAQTSSGIVDLYGRIDIGAYPDSTGVWGLLDTSGGLPEWTETVLGVPRFREVRGSGAGGGELAWMGEVLDADSIATPDLTVGLRLASAVPAPSAVFLASLVVLTHAARRRRTVL